MVPFATSSPVDTQIGCPEPHDVIPVWQGLPGMHAVPAVQAAQLPLEQTSFVPHDVPFATSSPVDTQIGCPELHDVVPVRQGLLLGVHAVPAVHAAQIPLVQTSFVPHAVPLAAFSVDTQIGCPELHDVVPVWQGLLGVHAVPAVHAAQIPLVQTSFVPHAVPLATSSPVETQIDCPELHDVVPVWQGLLGVHAVPAVHEPQIPLVQTSFVPHTVPLATSLPVDTQIDCPELHDVIPVRQELLGVHATPVAHETQLPFEHTSFVPHAVPLGTSSLVATQVERPVLHDVVPVRQGLLGVHAVPAVHEPQIPLEQTSPLPHTVPLATSLPVETHAECPVLHDVTPDWQGLLLGVHAAPAAHDTQLPLEHTSFIPQSVPLGTSPPVATQVECPVVHDVFPVRHASPAGVQATPAVHDPDPPGGSGRVTVRGAPALPADSEPSVAKSHADASAASPPQTTRNIYLRSIMTFDPPRRAWE